MHCSLDSSDQSQLENLELVEEVMVDRSTQTVWEDQSENERQSSRADWNQSGVSSMHCSLVSDQSQLEDHKLDEELTVGSPKERVSRWENMGYMDSQSSRAVWNQSGDSVVSSMYCSLFSSSSYHSEVEDCKVDEDLMKIIHRHMEDREEGRKSWEASRVPCLDILALPLHFNSRIAPQRGCGKRQEGIIGNTGKCWVALPSVSSGSPENTEWRKCVPLGGNDWSRSSHGAQNSFHSSLQDPTPFDSIPFSVLPSLCALAECYAGWESPQFLSHSEPPRDGCWTLSECPLLPNCLTLLQLQRASNQDEDVHFLAVLCTCCKAAYKSGQESLDLPYSKGQLIKAIVVVMEKSPVQSGPTILLLYAMAAVSCLSKIKPPTDPELESAILRFAVRGVITVQAGHVHKQALHKLAADNLELMLRGFLSEAPTTQHLLSLLEHINIWILSRNAQERARASKQCASLLRFSVMMPDCDNSAELPSLGHHVAKLGICIMDCRKDVSRNAREGIYRLLEVLLHHKGQSSREAGELWSRRWQEEERILAYLNTARVGEVFREIFNKDQERSFLRTTLWAINHPLHRVKEAGLILLYSLLGKADALMGYEEEEIRRKIWRRLRQIKESKGLPEEIEGDLLMDLGSAAKPTTLP
ncbi:uncharacterized protein LOC128333564 [Hemicordylus capensis]|uniref:uncharacterized protein LOC128333564 n=1 Tax=Hemicordylus capensis TaxID=884348 RepID=UPI00230453B1|nr:uncharacterized protein LOC128333564 [Hemicordylus capensis]